MPKEKIDSVFNLSEFHHDFRELINPMFPTSPTEDEILKDVLQEAQANLETSIRFEISKDECKLGAYITFLFNSGFINGNNPFLSYRGVLLD
ncbi:hypothetical protein BSQ39_04120 [Loigolactobacillus backii]|jgi:hypothetical protein|uniref:Uncharacterized protein n=6 Tax=Lactobacillaceae TaxID=33958 RepID=A0A0R1H263_9LACO|nr:MULTISPECIES: hypothetical protein [Lactobacillaceae]MCH4163811.1 hypothetical protein [Lentilactobacillus diolivorans]AVK64690.1 hypothetical protein C5Z26_11500 [Lactobacillus sp. CBA3606]KRK40533.1 hypothetical protein FC07_GL000305 [Loigolactobacillus bifermentans DSM 20003]KRL38080.1 hypothetical protein FD20_GL002346 [Liquorilactobacillus uvarum DSM 19971]KRM86336.1 hypothetical protein FD21_GL001644 [Liquorilactobacillus vini DSM 20605]